MTDDSEALAFEETKVGLRIVRAAVDNVDVLEDLLALGVGERDFYLPGLSVAWVVLCDALKAGTGLAPDLIRSRLEEALGAVGASTWKVIMSEKPALPGNLVDVVDHMRRRVAMRRLQALGAKLARSPIGSDPVGLARELEDEAARIGSDSISLAGADSRALAGFALKVASGEKQLFEHIPVGLGSVDKALGGGVARGRTTLFIARTGGGKSTFGKHAAISAAKSHAPVVIFSTEESREELANSLVEQLAGCRIPQDHKQLGRQAHSAISEAAATLADLPIFVEDRENVTAAQLVAITRIYAQRHGVKVAVIDYVQDLDLGDAREPDHILHARNSRTLKVGARRSNVAMIQLAQVSADTKDEPTADGVAGGKRYAKDAVATVIFERDRESKDENKRNVSRVALKKNRLHGSLATTWLRYDPNTTRLSECGADGKIQSAVVEMKQESTFWDSGDEVFDA